jgi:hypothetical protein
MPGGDASKDVGSIGHRRTRVLYLKKISLSVFLRVTDANPKLQYLECQTVDMEGLYFNFGCTLYNIQFLNMQISKC